MGGRVESLAKGWWQADLGRGPVRWGFEASYTAPEKWIETFEADGLKKGKKKVNMWRWPTTRKELLGDRPSAKVYYCVHRGVQLVKAVSTLKVCCSS